MAISEVHAGRSYPATAPYQVSPAKIAEFATALGDESPSYRGADPIAPPTFLAVITTPAWELMFDDPELELTLSRIVHGDQRFSYARPLRAGDVVTGALTIDKVRVRGVVEIISASVEVTTVDGEPICTAQATFLHSREEAA
jgi:acyl dehydratase